jgi:metallo-beta-lactamase family protein
MKLTFLGATGTVTGSKYLIDAGETRLLVDCGLFQGYKQLRLRNWSPLPVPAASIDAVVLTHAHLDHSGYLPLLAKNGFRGKVYCTQATLDLCDILLPDSGYLQEEQAAFANRHGFSKHKPALPLYTQEDARRCLRLLEPVEFEQEFKLSERLTLRLLPSGHILGAALALLRTTSTSTLFSGDLGRPNDLIMRPPHRVESADYLVLESTYGDRRHDAADPRETMGPLIAKAAARGGVIVIPSFAVGRAQSLLYYIHLLKSSRAIPDIPVYLNSPMAVDATRIFHNHRGEHRLTPAQCDALCDTAHIVNSVEESKALNTKRGPMIIISASGMATGGRVLHHLKAFAPDPRNLLLLAGFQAGGTRGAAIADGAQSVKIHGEYVPIRAEVAMLSNLSAHADYAEILDWLSHFKRPPRTTFITHGEPAAADALRRRIEEQKAWNCRVPDYLEETRLE